MSLYTYFVFTHTSYLKGTKCRPHSSRLISRLRSTSYCLLSTVYCGEAALNPVSFFLQFPKEFELYFGRTFERVTFTALMAVDSHLFVNFRLRELDRTAFFQCLKPLRFINRQNASALVVVLHNASRTAVIAHNRGRACL